MMGGGEDNVAVRLDLRGRREFSQEARAAGRDIRGIGRDAQAANTHLRSASGGMSLFSRGLHEIGTVGARAFTYGMVGVVGAATAAAGAFTAMGIQSVASFEQAEIAFDTMLPAGMDARAFLEDLERFAARTPFEFPGLVHGTQQLLAFGFEASDLLPLMERIGDAASGLGAGQEGIDRMTRALGQMRTAGRANSRDMMQLTEVGVPAWQYLADAAGTSIGDIRKAVEQGEVDSMSAVRAIVAGMERDFGGLMERQATTIGGRWSTLMDTIRLSGRRAFEPFRDDMSNALLSATNMMEDFGEWFATNAPGVIDAVISNVPRAFEAAMSGNAGAFGEAMGDMFGGNDFIADTMTTLFEMGQDVVTIFRDLLLPILVDLGEALPISPLRVVAGILGFVADNASTLRPILTMLLAGFLAFKTVTMILGAVKLAFVALNLVMNANPIALVVAAIAALVVGLKWAYDNVDWFHNAVDAAWQILQDVWDVLLAVGEAFLRFSNPIGVAITLLQELGVGFDDIINGALTVAEVLLNAFLAPFRAIAEAWNQLDFGIHVSIPDWVPGVGGRGFNIDDIFPDIPVPSVDLPQLHSGGWTTTGGWANIQPDEEAVFLPPSAAVVPLEHPDMPNVADLMASQERVIILEVDREVLTRATLNGLSDMSVGR